MSRTPDQVRRAYETLDFIEAHPDKHDQAGWLTGWCGNHRTSYDKQAVLDDCGTAACFAGWFCLLNGRTFVSVADLDNGRHPAIFTRNELGLTPWDADQLFDPELSLDELKETFVAVFGPRPDGAL